MMAESAGPYALYAGHEICRVHHPTMSADEDKSGVAKIDVRALTRLYIEPKCNPRIESNRLSSPDPTTVFGREARFKAPT